MKYVFKYKKQQGSNYDQACGIFEAILIFIVVWLDGVGFAGYPLWGEGEGAPETRWWVLTQ